MNAMAERMEHSVQILISDWLFIDGTMDNHVQSAIDGAVFDEEGDTDDEAEDGDGPDDEDDWDEGPAADTDAEPDSIALPRVAQLGLSVRQAGWDQIPGWPRDAAGFETWPAPGQVATMTLTDAQWSLVVFALRHWAEVDERLSDAEGAARSRAIAADIEHHLAEQGWAGA
ncbi:hypothetical protein [Actinoplanes awajinensis]|uniref:Uncharacterized protein n=1 Tax=Actinoplanes awajinensis subsp. mycoplanecinus TaxID=135947 RepID=A0A0X3UP62_9ACTN|nr:hypothetical protein [Actinoplanes awajinensis]KUL34304.1 hypothetical protein ADL15_16875 [Actinoplanes awajinensis subsp. mycoplanecinus]